MQIPVIMYHSVGHPNTNWSWAFLTCPVATFESHIRNLAKAKYTAITLQELYDHMKHGKSVPKRAIVLTFDDGYLDNWAFAYPVLKKYGFKGTIFVNPDFVDPASKLRPTLEDVWANYVAFSDLPTWGFLSWREMREMEKDQVIDIQSHALTHTWYFKDNTIIDFRHPGDNYCWIDWNEYPRQKYDYLHEKYPENYGMPVYSYGPSLSTRRYFPDKEFQEFMVDYVTRYGGGSFFKSPEWRTRLYEVAKAYIASHVLKSHVETDSKYEARVREELIISKETIERELGKQVRFLCWPNGAYTELGLRIASEVGYAASTYSSREKSRRNIFGEDPSRVSRIAPPLVSNHNGNRVTYLDGRFFSFYLWSRYESTILFRLSFGILGKVYPVVCRPWK